MIDAAVICSLQGRNPDHQPFYEYLHDLLPDYTSAILEEVGTIPVGAGSTRWYSARTGFRSCFPRPRGWYHRIHRPALRRGLLPAHAGMVSSSRRTPSLPSTAPRAPVWSRIRLDALREGDLLPAHAGRGWKAGRHKPCGLHHPSKSSYGRPEASSQYMESISPGQAG
ncbi:MAG TPA: hypothetical protein DD420_36040 [Streptomyces sp.]|nr:hypothetical protein [Streptomyces sp.]